MCTLIGQFFVIFIAVEKNGMVVHSLFHDFLECLFTENLHCRTDTSDLFHLRIGQAVYVNVAQYVHELFIDFSHVLQPSHA